MPYGADSTGFLVLNTVSYTTQTMRKQNEF